MPARRLLSTCYFLPSACARLGPTRGVNFQKVAKSPIKSARKIELFLYPESSRADTIALEPMRVVLQPLMLADGSSPVVVARTDATAWSAWFGSCGRLLRNYACHTQR